MLPKENAPFHQLARFKHSLIQQLRISLIILLLINIVF